MKKSPLLIIFVTVFIDLLGFGIVIPLLPRYGERLAADNVTIGLLMASFSAMQFLFAPIWGRVSDRVGRRPILVIGLLGSAVFYALFGYATQIESLGLLFLARIGAGIAGANISTAQAYIADSTPPQQRAGGMAIIGAAFGIGFTFGPLLGSAWVSDDPAGPLSPAAGYVASGLSFLAFLSAVFLLPESLRPGAVPAERHWINVKAFREALAMPTIAALLLTFFLATFAFANFEGVFARITKDAFRFGDRDNFFGFAMVGLVLGLAQGVLVRRVGPRVGEVAMCVTGIALMTAGLCGIGGSVYYELAGPPSAVEATVGFVYAAGRPWFWVTAAGLVVLVVGYACLTPSIQALISRRSDPDKQGGILGLNQSASAMARILGPLLGNTLYGPLNHTVPFLLGAALMAAAFVLSLRIGAAPDRVAAPATGPKAE